MNILSEPAPLPSTHRWARPVDRFQTFCLIAFTVFSLFSISLTQIFAFLGGLAWLAHTHLNGAWNRLRFPVGVPWLLFSGACILATATALNPRASFPELKRIFEMAIFFWALNSLGNRDLRDFFSFALKPFHRNGPLPGWIVRLENMPPREFFFRLLLTAALAATALGLGRAAYHGLSLDQRVAGTFSIYVTFAGILMQLALMVTSLLLFRRGGRAAWGLVLLALLAGLASTLTRSSWLGFCVGLLFLLLVKRRALILILPLILAGAFLLSPQQVQDRMKSFTNGRDATFQSRLTMWRLGWDIFKKHPVTGCGFHCMQEEAKDYPEHADIFQRYRHLHSNFVQIAVDTGLIGLALWLFMWLSYFRVLWNEYHTRAPADPDRSFILGSAAAVIGFLTAGFFEYNFHDSEVAMQCFYVMAFALARRTKPAVSMTTSA